MFKSLREKFSGWLKKSEKEKTEEVDREEGKKAGKKETKKSVEEKLKEKADKIEKEAPLKFEVAKQKFEPDSEGIKELEEKVLKEAVVEEPEEVKEEGFFFRVKKKLLTNVMKQEEFDEIFEELEMTCWRIMFR
jgi:uncharacterized protein YktB (UPF0637 family)